MTSQSQTAAIYQTLKFQLLEGGFAPSERLKIGQISERCAASPGAVREALSRLTSDGLVVMVPQKGFAVAPISAADLKDLTAVRIDIETRCLRRAIEVGDIAWEGRIQDAWHRLKRTPSKIGGKSKAMNPAWTDVHSGFHDALVAACDSAWWLRLREQLFLQAERYRRMQISVIEKDRNANAEHKAIFDATIRRKADLACALLSDHLQKTTDHLLMYAPIFKDGELN